VRADGVDERRVARGARPAWSPLGRRIAFDRNGRIVSARWHGGDVKTIAEGTEPAYARDGRLAFVRDGRILVRGRAVARGRQPTWSPQGRLAYVRDRRIFVGGRLVARGTQPDWWLLGFTSQVDNVGKGALVVAGVRPSGEARMVATQRVLLSNGSWRPYADVGWLRFTRSPPHWHWHLMRFVAYELRSLDGEVLVRDRKSGFCLGDRYGRAPGEFVRRARFLGNCGQLQPEATEVLQGTSPGFTDRYLPFFHGQNVDITGVQAGTYVLVHRANEDLRLRESRYENDAASVRIRLRWEPDGPTVEVLRRCPETASC
jgi:hypothetical protein